MNILIVLNQTDTAKPKIQHDYLIGVDGGCEWCMTHNQKIDLAIGDFDSLNQRDIDRLSTNASKIEWHSQDKDQTDLELAIQAAMRLGPSKLIVYGVWGGRIDHSLANVFCLGQQTARIPVVMPGEKQSGFIIKGKQRISIDSNLNQTVSLIALGNDCSGITNKGFKYPLSDAILRHGVGHGLSNLTTHAISEISLSKGRLLVVTDTDSRVEIFTQQEENLT